MHILQSCRSSHPEVFCKKVISEISQNSQQNTFDRVSFLIKWEACARVSFLKLQASGLQPYEKETLALVFSCEFCKISKNTFYYRTPTVAASGIATLKRKTFQLPKHHFQTFLLQLKIKKLRLSFMIREVHFLFLLFVCHIWSVTIHQIFTMHLSRCRSSHRRCSVTKGVLRNFTKSTVKHLVQSLSFNQVAGVMFPCLYIRTCLCALMLIFLL